MVRPDRRKLALDIVNNKGQKLRLEFVEGDICGGNESDLNGDILVNYTDPNLYLDNSMSKKFNDLGGYRMVKDEWKIAQPVMGSKQLNSAD